MHVCNVTWTLLTNKQDLRDVFRLAVQEGSDPDGYSSKFRGGV